MAGSSYLTFDCYGTLIDWETGISEALAAAAATRGVRFERREILALHARIEPQVQAERYRSYRRVLEETACRLLAQRGLEITREEAGFLPESVPYWRPFPDTVPALRRLHRAGYRLGILSNIDDDLLAASLIHLEVPFDLLISAQQTRSYKPAPEHFRVAGRKIGETPWTHVAQSLFHDIEPATRLGISSVWINRKNEPRPESFDQVPEFLDVGRFAAARLRASRQGPSARQ